MYLVYINYIVFFLLIAIPYNQKLGLNPTPTTNLSSEISDLHDPQRSWFLEFFNRFWL